ncbi:MAG: sugar phosphate nucleotidyltransferase [Nitrososphaerota archaeon]
MKGVVFAAGYGRRLHPLTTTRPKHLLPLASKPLLLRVVEALRSVGVGEIGVTVAYMADRVGAVLTGEGVTIIQQQQVLGTGQALKECRPFLDGEDSFFVVYGDVTATAERLSHLHEFFQGGRFDGAMLAVTGRGPGSYGTVSIENSQLVSVAEKSGEVGLVNAGIYILPSEILDVVEDLPLSPRGEYELTDALNILVGRGRRLGVLVDEGDWWFDVGRPLDYLNANLYYTKAELEEAVVLGRGVVLGDGVRFHGPVLLGDYARVGSDTELVGPVVIGEGCEIAPHSSIAKSVLMENVRILDRCRLSYSILSEETVIKKTVEVEKEVMPSLVTAPKTRLSRPLIVAETLVI